MEELEKAAEAEAMDTEEQNSGTSSLYPQPFWGSG